MGELRLTRVARGRLLELAQVPLSLALVCWRFLLATTVPVP